MRTDCAELVVKAITLNRSTGEPAVLLQQQDGLSVVRVAVGAADASSIIVALDKANVREITSCDLLVDFFSRHKFIAECINVLPPAVKARARSMISGSLQMELRYRSSALHYRLKVRPADAILLSIKMRVPLLVARAALEKFAPPETAVALEATEQDVLLLRDIS